jgi:hypothetical protein
MSNSDDQMTLDLSSLDASDEPAVQAPPAPPAKPAKRAKKAKKRAKKQAKKASAPTTQGVTIDDLAAMDVMELVQQVLDNPNFSLTVTRKAWNGIRSRRRSQRVDGIRKMLKDEGFSITAKVEVPNGGGKLASAVYESEQGALVVGYGTEPGYGHSIRKAV